MVCGRSSAGNYCEAHQPVQDEAIRNARQQYRKHYRTADYERNRRFRFERSRGRCENCSKVVTWEGRDWQCDHLIALVDGGTNQIENLRVLCTPCHLAKTRYDRRKRAEG
jgi:5-methylcytosine-specific restriction endonuclease McrA